MRICPALALAALAAFGAPSSKAFGAAIESAPEARAHAYALREANIYERPPGKTYDFRDCSSDRNGPEFYFCRATGVLICDGIVSGVGTVLEVPDRRRDVILVNAHSMRAEYTNKPYRQCDFYPDAGRLKPTSIIASFVLNERPHDEDERGRILRNDMGVAVPADWISPSVGTADWGEFDEDELKAALQRGVSFFQIGYNGDVGRVQVSDRCGPVPSEPWFIHAHVAEEFKHDCNNMTGFSGGPLVMLDGADSKVVCVNSLEMGVNRHVAGYKFDPRVNPNGCMKITPEVARLIEKVAKSRVLPKQKRE